MFASFLVVNDMARLENIRFHSRLSFHKSGDSAIWRLSLGLGDIWQADDLLAILVLQFNDLLVDREGALILGITYTVGIPFGARLDV